MKKVANKLLASLLTVSLLAVGADLGAANNNYLTLMTSRESAMQRSLHSVGGDMGGAEGEKAADKDSKSNVSVRVGYSRTHDSAELGQYFTGNGSDVMKVNASATTAETEIGLVLRDSDGTVYSGTEKGTVTFAPRSQRLAASIDFSQSFDAFLEGGWVKVGAAFARVKNEVNHNDNAVVGTELTKFLAGDAMGKTEGLKYLRITNVDGTHESHLDDLDLSLGYNFVSNDSGNFGVYVKGTAGVGTEPKMVSLFESVAGSRHFRLGVGFCGNVSLLESDAHKARLMFDIDGAYLFKRDELRTARIKDVNFSQYHLAAETGGKLDGSITGKLPAPVANFVTKKISVEPRYVVNGCVDFVYERDCFTFDVGYLGHYKAKEENVATWEDNKYFRVIDATLGEAAAVGAAEAKSKAINAADLEWSEDSKYVHTIHGGGAYTLKDMDTPVSLGVGGSYGFASDKAKAESNWSVFGKLGVCF
jgi:hypothetical protein